MKNTITLITLLLSTSIMAKDLKTVEYYPTCLTYKPFTCVNSTPSKQDVKRVMGEQFTLFTWSCENKKMNIESAPCQMLIANENLEEVLKTDIEKAFKKLEEMDAK